MILYFLQCFSFWVQETTSKALQKQIYSRPFAGGEPTMVYERIIYLSIGAIFMVAGYYVFNYLAKKYDNNNPEG